MSGTAGLFVKSTAIALIALLFMVGCTSNSETEECFYETYDTHAEVIEILDDPDHEGIKLVHLDFKDSGLAFETQEMGELKGISIDQDFIDRNRINVGNKYEVVVSEISRGNCTPRFVTFNHTLE